MGNVLSILWGNTPKSCRSPVVGEPRLHHELEAHMRGGESKQRNRDRVGLVMSGTRCRQNKRAAF